MNLEIVPVEARREGSRSGLAALFGGWFTPFTVFEFVFRSWWRKKELLKLVFPVCLPAKRLQSEFSLIVSIPQWVTNKKEEVCVSLVGGNPSCEKYWLWDEVHALRYSQIALYRPLTLFLQHVAKVEALMPALESMLATRSLSVSPDERISSRPLKRTHNKSDVSCWAFRFTVTP